MAEMSDTRGRPMEGAGPGKVPVTVHPHERPIASVADCPYS